MKRKILVALIITMLLSAMPLSASAATAIPYRSVTTNSHQVRFEKAGSYYIWVKDWKRLYYSKSKTGKATLLKGLKSTSKYYLDKTVITNGKTIYYMQYKDATSSQPAKATVYKTAIGSKKHTKVFSFINPDNICAYYNGKIYYSAFKPDEANFDIHNVYAYDLKSHKTKLVVANAATESSYGACLTAKAVHGNYNKPQYIINLKNHESKKMANCLASMVYKDKIRYISASSDYSLDTLKFRECSVNADNYRTIKTIRNANAFFVGRIYGYYEKNNKTYKFKL